MNPGGLLREQPPYRAVTDAELSRQLSLGHSLAEPSNDLSNNIWSQASTAVVVLLVYELAAWGHTQPAAAAAAAAAEH